MKFLKFIFLLVFSLSFSQTNNIFERLSALENGGKIWYNIDGYSVTSEIFNNNFDEKGLKKVFRKHNISGYNFPEFPQEVIDSNPIDIFYNKIYGLRKRSELNSESDIIYSTLKTIKEKNDEQPSATIKAKL